MKPIEYKAFQLNIHQNYEGKNRSFCNDIHNKGITQSHVNGYFLGAKRRIQLVRGSQALQS